MLSLGSRIENWDRRLLLYVNPTLSLFLFTARFSFLFLGGGGGGGGVSWEGSGSKILRGIFAD